MLEVAAERRGPSGVRVVRGGAIRRFHAVFLVAGERQYMVKEAALFRAVGREIRKTDPHGRMIGIHPGPGPYISSQEFAAEDWMSFGDYAQAYFAPSARLRKCETSATGPSAASGIRRKV